jgi:hypothetical protein
MALIFYADQIEIDCEQSIDQMQETKKNLIDFFSGCQK